MTSPDRRGDVVVITSASAGLGRAIALATNQRLNTFNQTSS
jgi:NADP-dependent 3-hydroxy acid dehydrogenase YdfG